MQNVSARQEAWRSKLSIREIGAGEAELIVGYFHSAPSEHLELMGVERAKLPQPGAWIDRITTEMDKSPASRQLHYLCWLYDGEPVGHSHINDIEYGSEAYMHLHIWPEPLRRRGMGAAFVRLSVPHYFSKFELQRLYCQPNANNDAPNRTLAQVGFRFLDNVDTTPSPINFPQTVSRWMLTREDLDAPGNSAL